MSISKKLIAIALCLALLPCALLSVFAEGETTPTPAGASEKGEVLYYQRFDKNFNLTLDDVGLIGSEKASIDADGFLASQQFTSATKLAVLPVGLSTELASFTLESTFRFKSGAWKQGCIVFDIGGSRVGLLYTNASTFGTVDDTFKENWKISPLTNVGNWVNIKMEVTENKLTAVKLAVNGETLTISGEDLKTKSTLDVSSTGVISVESYQAGLQIGELRLVSGVDYTQYVGEYASKSFSGDNDPTDLTFPEAALPPAEGIPSIPYEDGKVLYYQRFDRSFNMTDLSATGLTSPDDFAKFGNSGYLEANNVGTGYNQVVALPDVIPEGLTTYTFETTFRFVKGTYKTGGVQMFWYESEDTRAGINLRYNQDGTFEKVGTVDKDVAQSWLVDMFDEGSWITIKAGVKDAKLYKVTVLVEDPYTKEILEWSISPEYQMPLPTEGPLAIEQGQANVQYRSVRVVEGVDYTAYVGENTNKSHSGHIDPVQEAPAGAKPDGSSNDNKPSTSQDTQETASDTSEDTAAESASGGCGSSASAIYVTVFVALIACGIIVFNRRKIKE